jgi:hypothetical protein
MSEIVQQHGYLGCFIFFRRYFDAFCPQVVQHSAHEMHGT